MVNEALGGNYQTVTGPANPIAEVVVFESAEAKSLIKPANLIKDTPLYRQTEANQHIGVFIFDRSSRKVFREEVQVLKRRVSGFDLLEVSGVIRVWARSCNCSGLFE